MRLTEGFVEADGLDHGSGHYATSLANLLNDIRRRSNAAAYLPDGARRRRVHRRHHLDAARSGAGGNLPAMRGDELLASVPGLAEIAEIEPIDWGLVPASHLSFEHVLEIGRLIADRLAQPEIDGVVVVQGTDVIEETAFALGSPAVAGQADRGGRRDALRVAGGV